MASGRLVKPGAAAAVALFAAACGGNAVSSTAAVGAPTVSPSVSIPPSTAAGSPTSAPSASTPPTTSSPAALASASASATASVQSCTSYAATHTFAEITAAKESSNGALTITAHRSSVVCGGPDDMHYNVAAATQTADVTPSATVRMLTSYVQLETVPHAAFSASLKDDVWGRIFMVTGPLSAITALTEMYHP